jgi:cytochrome c peroxidase
MGLVHVFCVSAQEAVPDLPDTPFAYSQVILPAHFAGLNGQPAAVLDADNTPADNPVTDAGATLGRVLFYDTRLSLNQTISCSSCHQQAHGFSDPQQLSAGFEGGQTARHSMGLSNARFYSRGHFFWDERADTLEDQVLAPVQDPVEMGMELGALVSRLSETDFYPPLFTAAFGDSQISAERISLALAQFVRSMVSYRSKFDLAFTSAEPGPPDFEGVLSEEEYLGLQLFSPIPGSQVESLRCDRCHTTAAQISENVENNGLDANTDDDQGAGGGRFKAPSLRDVAARAPYMHDGRFDSLDAVVEFYSNGVQDHPQLSPRLRENGQQGGAPVRPDLSMEEKGALVAFLNTLSDPFLLNDIAFSDPFSPPVASLDVFSGSWYDPAHDGEGWIIEVLDDDNAVIYWFTYDQAGNQMWMVGVAHREDNMLLADMLLTSGPAFGPGFDPQELEYTDWGSVVLTFTSCDSAELDYVSGLPGFGSGSLRPQKLVGVDGLNCQQPSQVASSRFSGWSGSWYDPSHDGEGWILEVIDAATAVVYWFSYDSNGEQVWMISMADIDDNGITGGLLSTSGPVFGQDFNPDDVRYEDWGTLTMSFADCNLASVEYDSSLAEFGSGGLLPQRLTSLSGLPCHEAPNILMVIADDFGVDAFGAYGLNDAAAATPVLDEMAASGLLFENFWASPSCSPTRANILSGEYAFRTGVFAPGDVLATSQLSLQDFIEQNLPGVYNKAVIGKWHLGRNNNTDHPLDLGVDYFAGILGGGVPAYDDWVLTENGQQSTSTEYVTSKLVDLSIDWVQQQQQPWFLWLAFNAPHEPFHLPPADLHSQTLSGTEQDIEQNPLPYYQAMIEAMDTETGRLLDSLTEAQRENTLLVFIGDNGTPRSVVQAPFSRAQGKGSLYQGGINVPLLISGGPLQRAGQRESALVNATDLFATIAEVAGAVGETPVDSNSFAGLLSGRSVETRSHLYAETQTDEVRSWAVRNDRFKLIEDEEGRSELYDLLLDPFENQDLVSSGQVPDGVIAELQALMEDIRQ